VLLELVKLLLEILLKEKLYKILKLFLEILYNLLLHLLRRGHIHRHHLLQLLLNNLLYWILPHYLHR
tara:strand:+ start:516 stop:716 length:201 start_codon:yes stop_codon:yes gene_type:complete